MLLDPGEKLVPEVYENLPCCLNLFNKRNIMSALNKESPDFNLIKGKSNMSIGAASKMRPAKINAAPRKTDKIMIKNLTFFEIF